MDKIEIYGGHQLKGTVSIAGAKNAALPLMCTSLLTDQCIILKNVPSSLSDIVSMAKLLKQTGVEIQLSKKEQEKYRNLHFLRQVVHHCDTCRLTI